MKTFDRNCSFQFYFMKFGEICHFLSSKLEWKNAIFEHLTFSWCSDRKEHCIIKWSLWKREIAWINDEYEDLKWIFTFFRRVINRIIFCALTIFHSFLVNSLVACSEKCANDKIDTHFTITSWLEGISCHVKTLLNLLKKNVFDVSTCGPICLVWCSCRKQNKNCSTECSFSKRHFTVSYGNFVEVHVVWLNKKYETLSLYTFVLKRRDANWPNFVHQRKHRWNLLSHHSWGVRLMYLKTH